jgi:hypothetical protein
MNVGVYWTDTVAKLAQMAEDKTAIIRLYCGDCTVLGGSVSAGGDGTGGSWINGSVGLEPFLAAWGALTSPHLPDAISWHAYPSRTTIKPAPFPETLTAHGSGNMHRNVEFILPHGHQGSGCHALQLQHPL